MMQLLSEVTIMPPGLWQWFVEHQDPILVTVIGGLLVLVIAGLWRWPFLRGKTRNDPGGQTTNQLFKTGMRTAAEIAAEPLATRIAELEEQLAAATQRVERAAKEGDEPAKDALEQIRETGDKDKLLEFLLARRESAAADVTQLDSEIASVAYMVGEIDTSEAAARRMLAADGEDLFALNMLGWIADLRGDLPAAEQHYSRVLDLAKGKSDRSWEAIALGNLGLIYKTRGDLDQAEKMHRKSLEIEKQLGRKEGMASDYGNLGLIYMTRGDLGQAEKMHLKSLEIEEQLGRKEGMASDYGNLGLIYMTRGDLDKAEKMLRKALAIGEQLGDKEKMARALGNLGLIYGKRGDLDQAEKMFRDGLEIDEQLGRKEGMASEYGNLGLIYQTRGDLDQAEKMYRKALALFQRIGMKPEIEKVKANLADVASKRAANEGGQ